MTETDLTTAFWNEFCNRIPAVNRNQPYQVWYFGDSREMAKALANLVIAGKKTATASLLAINEAKPEIAPVLNGYSVVTDFDGVPQCIVQTTELRVVPFNCVDAEFAFDEGEDDQTLESWRAAHWQYFSKECAEANIELTESSLIVCEKFKLLYQRAKV